MVGINSPRGRVCCGRQANRSPKLVYRGEPRRLGESNICSEEENESHCSESSVMVTSGPVAKYGRRIQPRTNGLAQREAQGQPHQAIDCEVECPLSQADRQQCLSEMRFPRLSRAAGNCQVRRSAAESSPSTESRSIELAEALTAVRPSRPTERSAEVIGIHVKNEGNSGDAG